MSFLVNFKICVSKRKCYLLKTHGPFPTDVPELLYLNWNLKKKSFVIYERATKRDKKKKITTSIFCTVLIVRLGNLIRIVHWSASRTSNFTSIGIFLRQVKFLSSKLQQKTLRTLIHIRIFVRQKTIIINNVRLSYTDFFFMYYIHENKKLFKIIS